MNGSDGSKSLLVPGLEVADLRGLAVLLEVAAADLVVPGGVVVEVRVELLEQDRVVDHRCLVVDDVPHVQQQPLLEREPADVQHDVLAGVAWTRPTRCCRWSPAPCRRSRCRSSWCRAWRPSSPGRGPRPSSPTRSSAWTSARTSRCATARPPAWGRAPAPSSGSPRWSSRARSLVAVGRRAGAMAGSAPGQSHGGAVVSSDGPPPPRATGTARASGCLSRKPAGSGTPWIACRSTQTFATERAARTSSARSARARAAGDSDAVRRSSPSASRSPVVSATWLLADRAATRMRACTWVSRPVGPPQPEAVGLALEVGAPHQRVDQSLGRLLPRHPARRSGLGHDAVDLACASRATPGPRPVRPPAPTSARARRPQPVVVLAARDQRRQGEQQHQQGSAEQEHARTRHGEDLRS